MMEILTKSGAVIHADADNPTQQLLLDVAVSAFGGAVSITESDQT